MSGLNLSEKVGPLPLGAWIGVVGAGVAYGVYQRRNSASMPADTQSDTSGVPGVGTGAVGGYVGNTTPTPTTPGITDNAAWGKAGTNELIAEGYDPALADSAIRKYLASAQLSVSEYALIRLVLLKIGTPPEPLVNLPADAPSTGDSASVTTNAQWLSKAINAWVGQGRNAVDIQAALTQWLNGQPVSENQFGGINWAVSFFGAPPEGTHGTSPVVPTQAATPVAPPAPVAAPAPVANHVYYTVRPGDNLSSIAARYPQPSITWQSIYNNNRDKIANPSRIYAGQELLIY